MALATGGASLVTVNSYRTHQQRARTSRRKATDVSALRILQFPFLSQPRPSSPDNWSVRGSDESLANREMGNSEGELPYQSHSLC
jgi:hypothetical protein